MKNEISITRLRASDIPSPYASGAAEVTVTSNGHYFGIGKGHDSKCGYYYTVRCAPAVDAPWSGYRIEHSIADVRRLILNHS